jgi:amino acid adenylation domain-containing protein
MPDEIGIRQVDPQELGGEDRSLRGKTVHQLFAEQAAVTPDAVAVLFEDLEIGYAELNERANRLAHHLKRRGVLRGDMIGLCMQRSPEMIVGLLGILKAGGAYVPLDPTYPNERLAFILRDTAAPWIVAHRPTADRLAPLSREAGVLCLDADAGAIAVESVDNPVGCETPDDLAYVMYTSGSTGAPKGVLVVHRGVVRLVRDSNYCHFGAEEVFLHLAPLAFDASTFEIWGALLNGGCLAILPPIAPTPDELDSAIRRYGVTTLWLTAGLFHLVVEQRVEALGPLRQLVAGGDVLSSGHVSRALAAMQDGVLVNGYGPTESTTFACCYRMKKGYRPGNTIPIGRPIPKSTCYVLDEQLQPVSIGTPGELFIGGNGLARGYLNNPELTEQRFVVDPFSADPTARLYRTGDRVRMREDGNLEFLGRFDNQVKILGHRVEPGEIEATLQQHPGVRQSVVVARTRPRGEKQLVAFVVAASGADFSAGGLKRYLAERLPPHMVPGHIVRIDALPLNRNGKLDRAGLCVPDRSRPAEQATGPPRTEWEAKLTMLWGRVLGCGVGVDENFFDLGGNSLQLFEIHAELTKMIGVHFSVVDLFEYTTVRSLADRLTGISHLDGTFQETQDRARRQKDAFARRKQAKGSGV